MTDTDNVPGMTLPDKMRLMADGAKEPGAAYDYEELLRAGANEIERLQNLVTRREKRHD